MHRECTERFDRLCACGIVELGGKSFRSNLVENITARGYSMKQGSQKALHKDPLSSGFLLCAHRFIDTDSADKTDL